VVRVVFLGFEKEKGVSVCPSFFSIVRLNREWGGTVSLKIRIDIADPEHVRGREIGKSGYTLHF